MVDKHYSQEEADAILRRAIESMATLDQSLTEDDLLDSARNMGLDEEVVREQIRQHEQKKLAAAEEAERKHLRIQRQGTFLIHLVLFVIVNAVVFLGPVKLPGPRPMVGFFPFFPWILFLIVHGLVVFFGLQIGPGGHGARRSQEGFGPRGRTP